MSSMSTYLCDVCGKQKESSNHWWIAYVDGGFGLWSWDKGFPDKSSAIHLCGEGCAVKMMSEWMETTSKTTT